jgi:hypothetical protein
MVFIVMSNLLLSLLDGPSRHHPTPERRPTVERRADSFERRSRFSERRREPNLVESLRRSASMGESVTLNGSEVRRLLRLIEATHADPFASGDSVLDDSDLKTLGVEAGQVGDQYGLRDHGDVPREEEPDPEFGELSGELSNKQPLFGPESALVAPDCTPGGRDDIPDSVLRSMKVLSGEEDVEEYTGPVEDQDQGEPIRSQVGPIQNRGVQQRSRTEQPRPEQPKVESASPISILRVTKMLREGSKKQHSRKVIKKELTEEQRAAISKLGGPSDPLE